MTPRGALRAATRALGGCGGCRDAAAEIERLEGERAAQTRANGVLLTSAAARDAELARARAQIKALKDERGRLTGFLITALTLRGEAAHRARMLQAVADPAAPAAPAVEGGGEAA